MATMRTREDVLKAARAATKTYVSSAVTIEINDAWCKGCRICVEFCPPKVLALDADEDHPRVVAPEKCTACHFCDTHCPDLAIVVRKLD